VIVLFFLLFNGFAASISGCINVVGSSLRNKLFVVIA
jgi:hypothetical protein